MNLTLTEQRLKVFILQKLQENQGILDIKENFEIEEAAKQLDIPLFRMHDLKQEAMNEFVEIPVVPTNHTIIEENTNDNEQNTLEEVQPEETGSSATTIQQEISIQHTTVAETVEPVAPPPQLPSEFTFPIKEEAKLLIRKYLEEVAKAAQVTLHSPAFAKLPLTTQQTIQQKYTERKESMIKAWKFLETTSPATLELLYDSRKQLPPLLPPQEKLLNVVCETATQVSAAYHLPVDVSNLLVINPKPKEKELVTTTEHKPTESVKPPFLSKKFFIRLMTVLGISFVVAIAWKFFHRPKVYSTECHKNSTQLHYVGELEREYHLEWQPLNSAVPQTYKFRIYDVDREGIFRFDIEGLGAKYQGLYGKVVDFQLSLDTLGVGILEKSKTHYTIKSLRKRPQWTVTAQYCR